MRGAPVSRQYVARGLVPRQLVGGHLRQVVPGVLEGTMTRSPTKAGQPDERLAPIVRTTARALLRALERRLQPTGVPVGHWTFLRVLWQRDGVTQRELSIAVGVQEPTALTALRRMEAAGLVRRHHRGANRKNVYVSLTEQGRALEAQLMPLALEVNRIATRGIPARDLALVRSCLLSVVGNLAAAASCEGEPELSRTVGSEDPMERVRTRHPSAEASSRRVTSARGLDRRQRTR